jgi:tetratricopeptide (TPR) repeat protein
MAASLYHGLISAGCVLACLISLCGAPDAYPAGGAPALKAEALKAAGDLRARLEKSTAAEPLRQLQQAIRSLKSANEINSYGMMLMLAGAPKNALIVLTAALQAAPDHFLAFNNLGAMLNNLGQFKTALPLLKYADSIAPNNPMVLSNLGNSWIGSGNIDEAERLYRRAVALAPKHPEANYALGVLAGRRGDTRAAEDFLNRSLDGSFTDIASKALRSLRRDSRRSAAGSDKSAKTPAPTIPMPPAPILPRNVTGQLSVKLRGWLAA